MLPEKILLVDSDASLVQAWEQAFAEFPEVVPSNEDYFSVQADAMVSPANCFGIMDGGLDRAIRSHLGSRVQGNVQKEILEQYHGELPVGTAVIVKTESLLWPYLVAAPTMRIPESVAQSINAYLAFRAILLEVRRFNQAGSSPRIKSIICSGLGTGIGQMSARRCAGQMRIAYNQFKAPAQIGTFTEIHELHHVLRSL